MEKEGVREPSSFLEEFKQDFLARLEQQKKGDELKQIKDSPGSQNDIVLQRFRSNS